MLGVSWRMAITRPDKHQMFLRGIRNDINGMITPFSPQRYTYRDPFSSGSRVAVQRSNVPMAMARHMT